MQNESLEAKEVAMDMMNGKMIGIIKDFCDKFGNFKNPTNVKMSDINENGLEITCDEGKIFIPFLQRAKMTVEGLRDEMMALLSSVADNEKPLDKIQKSMFRFVDNLNSAIISSVHSNGQCVSSYAPFIREDDKVYLCISSVSEHFESISDNPNKISIMFIEDEENAKTAFARVRLSVKCDSEFLSNEQEKQVIWDKLSNKLKGESSIAYVRTLKDFHILKATFKDGRFVKGFGAAYDTKGLEVISQADNKNPHQL